MDLVNEYYSEGNKEHREAIAFILKNFEADIIDIKKITT